jgi:hypothetical protein
MSETNRPRKTSRHFSGKTEIDPEMSQTIQAMIESLGDFPNPEVVIGNGWAALMAVGFLATKKSSDGSPTNVLWLTNSGSRAMAPLPFVESGIAAGAWRALMEALGIISDEPQTGQYLREYRHRSFSRTPWQKSPTAEMRKGVLTECLWGPEVRLAPLFETRFDLSIAEMEDLVRDRIHKLSNVRILSGVPVTGFAEGSLTISTGATIAFKRAIWADRWVGLGGIEGLPKGSSLARNREPMGILQTVFTHSTAMADQAMQEAFYGATHKDAGEEFNRSVWGYFFEGGRKSVWTLFLTEEEGADNHSIGKKYRRMRQALDKMFTGTEWLPEGVENFSATIVNEQLLFQEDFMFGNGESVVEPQKVGPILFMTDAFGVSAAAEQVARALASEIGLDLESMSDKPVGENAETGPSEIVTA